MVFNSLIFLVFFVIVFVLYYTIPSRYRWFLLLASSCYFYAVFIPRYLFVLFFLIVTDYVLALRMEKTEGTTRKIFLILSIVANLGTLVVFKYFNFFNENIAALASLLHWNYPAVTLRLLLPVGLSFHVFQSLSYVIEVYKDRYPAERDMRTYALYVMFFPQLVAGPIERPQHLLPQFKTTHVFSRVQAVHGLQRMLWGFFKKLVIADQIALSVNYIYSGFSHTTPPLIFPALLFAYQLYCDFSGYSDIAVGSAMMLGYELTENFDRPYAAKSISEFWRRWHISLSSWLRDYLYYPLAFSGSKTSRFRSDVSIFVTFVLIGLWHGASWTFMALGALHGIYSIVGSRTKNLRDRLYTKIFPDVLLRLRPIAQVGVTFLLAAFGWIFFRAENMQQAFFIIRNLGTGLLYIFDGNWLRYEFLTGQTIGINKADLLVIICAIVFLEVVQYVQNRSGTVYVLDSQKQWVWWCWYYAVLFAILLFGFFGSTGFIYFQF